MKLPIDKKTHLRHKIFFLYFENKHDPKPVKSQERITNIYEDNFCSLNNFINWIKMLKNDDYSFEDKLISGRPTKIDKDHLNNSLNENSRETTRELADKFECSKSSVNYHLKKLGKIHKSSAIVPYELNPNQNKKRVEICNNLLLRHKQTYGHTRDFTKPSHVVKSGANT